MAWLRRVSRSFRLARAMAMASATVVANCPMALICSVGLRSGLAQMENAHNFTLGHHGHAEIAAGNCGGDMAAVHAWSWNQATR